MDELTGKVDPELMVRMPRPPRLQYEGAFYHVYTRGNRRKRTDAAFVTEGLANRTWEDFYPNRGGAKATEQFIEETSGKVGAVAAVLPA
jgi:hypothetical protein